MRVRNNALVRGILIGASYLVLAVPSAAQPVSETLRWQLPYLAEPVAITADEYAARRQLLMEALGDGVLAVFGAPAPAADYLPFQQNADFRFLTGITEPSAVLILSRIQGQVTERLFVRPRNPTREVWEGPRMGLEGAYAMLGITTQGSERAVQVLDSLLTVHETLFVLQPLPDKEAANENLSYEQQVLARLLARHEEIRVRPASLILDRLRAKKSTKELDLIRRAVYISAAAHREAMRAAWPGMNEFEIRALVEFIFARHGADGPAYASIVGSGPNATTLHYNAANRFMRDGELLLMDVGASYAGYAADVTRTVPVNGMFTPNQRAIYDIVLAAQKAAEARLRAGATWKELNDAANAEIANGLSSLGLIDSPTATYACGATQCPQYRLFYMHGLGHGVGLEVHDPDISTYTGFQTGSAVTIEPGIYVRGDAFAGLTDTPENRAFVERRLPALQRFANIGVRIEDVYIVDEKGVERVSRGAPRERNEIEQLMVQASPTSQLRRGDVVNWFRGLSARR